MDGVPGYVDNVLRIKIDCLIPERYFSLTMDDENPVVVLMLIEGCISPGFDPEIADEIVRVPVLGTDDNFSIYSFDV